MKKINLLIFQKSNLPYVEYTSNIENEEERISQAEKEQTIAISENTSVTTSTVPQQTRAVARKSTSKKQNVVDTNTYNPTTETKPSHSIVVSTWDKVIEIISTRKLKMNRENS